jgi:hypothetical protein
LVVVDNKLEMGLPKGFEDFMEEGKASREERAQAMQRSMHAPLSAQFTPTNLKDTLKTKNFRHTKTSAETGPRLRAGACRVP